MSKEVEKCDSSPICFGTYDPDDSDCTKVCAMRERCEKQTRMSGKPTAPAKPALSKEAEPVDGSPQEYLMSMIHAKYSVETAKEEAVTVFRLKRDGVLQAIIRAADDGGYYIVTRKAKVELVKLESVSQVQHLWQAIAM